MVGQVLLLNNEIFLTSRFCIIIALGLVASFDLANRFSLAAIFSFAVIGLERQFATFLTIFKALLVQIVLD